MPPALSEFLASILRQIDAARSTAAIDMSLCLCGALQLRKFLFGFQHSISVVNKIWASDKVQPFIFLRPFSVIASGCKMLCISNIRKYALEKPRPACSFVISKIPVLSVSQVDQVSFSDKLSPQK